MAAQGPLGSMVMAPYGATDTHAPVRVERRSKPAPAPFPPVDEHLVVPEVTRDEVIRGRKVVAMAALFPHAKAQGQLAFLIAPHVRPGYSMPTELLTRASHASDFATDVCVCRDGIDPTTGSRYLEELSFEVVNEQKPGDISDKAEDLIGRGVRRVFGIFVKTGQACEWSNDTQKFVPLDPTGVLDDELFVRPIAVKALIDHAASEVEVAKALITKKNPEIVKLKHNAEQHGHKKGFDEGHKKGLDEGHKEGHKKGLDEGHKKGLDEGLDVARNMFRQLLRQRFGELSVATERRLEVATAKELERFTAQIFSVASIDELFGSDTAAS